MAKTKSDMETRYLFSTIYFVSCHLTLCIMPPDTLPCHLGALMP